MKNIDYILTEIKLNGVNFILENIESIPDLVEILLYASDRYYNYGDSPLTDEEFNAIERYLYSIDKTNPYFIGVGSSTRGEKIKLPYPMGGLEQIMPGDIKRWVLNNNFLEENLIITDKMDGVSCLLIYNEKGEVQIAYSRGDGVYAQDITRHVAKIKNLPTNIQNKMVIRGEIEMSNSDFEKSKQFIKSKSGLKYKNARNCVSGLMNSDINDENVYEYLSFIAYQIIDNNLDKIEQLKKLELLNFKIPSYKTILGRELTDEFLINLIKERKKELDYAIDGVVIDINNKSLRLNLSSLNDLFPNYSVKYKTMDDNNLAIANVIGVEWNVSKHGLMKPRVNIEPIELSGVTIQYATGFNAKFIKDNNIGPGAKIKITRSGDVIPYILGVVEPSIAQMPLEETYWNENNVDLILNNFNENINVMIEQTLSFFENLDIPMLKEGNIKLLFQLNKYESSINAISKILNYDKIELENFIGENGIKIFEGLRLKLKEVEIYDLMGSLPFFGIGLGSRRFKKLISSLKITNIEQIKSLTIEKMITVDTIEEKTAIKIFSGINSFLNFYYNLPKYINVLFYKELIKTNMIGKSVVFTGFRDSELHNLVEKSGGEMKTSVSKKTSIVVCLNPNSNSTKIQKAKELGIQVISVEELKKMLGVMNDEKIHKVKNNYDDILIF